MEEETKKEEPTAETPVVEEPTAETPVVEEPTAEEKAEISKKAREEYEEAIVKTCRENFMPILIDSNLGIKDSSQIIETLFQTIQQALLNLAKDKNISDLCIKDAIDMNYPNADLYLKILDSIGDSKISFIMQCIQWFSRKIVTDTEMIYKDKTFKEVVKEF
jgi:hypothetical protein